jgi:hypothetical protein
MLDGMLLEPFIGRRQFVSPLLEALFGLRALAFLLLEILVGGHQLGGLLLSAPPESVAVPLQFGLRPFAIGGFLLEPFIRSRQFAVPPPEMFLGSPALSDLLLKLVVGCRQRGSLFPNTPHKSVAMYLQLGLGPPALGYFLLEPSIGRCQFANLLLEVLLGLPALGQCLSDLGLDSVYLIGVCPCVLFGLGLGLGERLSRLEA